MKKKVEIYNYDKLVYLIYNKIALWNNDEEEIKIKQEKLKILSAEIIDIVIDHIFESLSQNKKNE